MSQAESFDEAVPSSCDFSFFHRLENVESSNHDAVADAIDDHELALTFTFELPEQIITMEVVN